MSFFTVSNIQTVGGGAIATATQAAAGAGRRNVATALLARIVRNSGALITSLVLRDGATLVGPILFEASAMNSGAGVGENLSLSGLFIVGSANTAMTLEFTASAATHGMSVMLHGQVI